VPKWLQIANDTQITPNLALGYALLN